jgi:hypothetical protein
VQDPVVVIWEEVLRSVLDRWLMKEVTYCCGVHLSC